MKKIILIFALIFSIGESSFGQSVDDGLVTSHLPINTASQNFVSVISGFREGLRKVKDGEIRSFDEVAGLYGQDVRNYPSLRSLTTTPPSPSFEAAYSARFVRSLLLINENIGVSYNDISQIRNSYRDLAISGNLSSSEAEALAFIDVSLQTLSNDMSLNSFSDQSIVRHDTKLTTPMPRWLRCALGVIGSAALGGLRGVGAGAAVGGALGGAVGGIIGVVGGTFVGAASFCGANN